MEERRMLAVAEGCQLYVGGLAIRCDDESLRAHFGRFGTVSDALVIRDKETGLSRGFGFVTLTDVGRAKEAVKQCNGREAKGLCPQHGRMQVRLASKSKAQQDFEARRAKAQGSALEKAGGAGANGQAAASNGNGKESSVGSSDEDLGEDGGDDGMGDGGANGTGEPGVGASGASGAGKAAGLNGVHAAAAVVTEEED